MKKVLVPLLGCVVIGLVSCGSNKKEQKTFNEIFDFAPIATSIKEVKVTHGPGQVLPLQDYDLNYSKDEAYFKQIEEYAKKAKFTEIAGSDVYYGGDTYSVSISLDSEEKKLSFVKKDELHIDNKIYKSSIEFPVPTEEQTYKVNHYINPLQKVTFNLNGETKDIGNFNLADIIFEYENKPEGSSEINKNAVLTVENSNVEIVIESAKKFYYDEKYCSVVGNKDFSELLNK